MTDLRMKVESILAGRPKPPGFRWELRKGERTEIILAWTLDREDQSWLAQMTTLPLLGFSVALQFSRNLMDGKWSYTVVWAQTQKPQPKGA